MASQTHQPSLPKQLPRLSHQRHFRNPSICTLCDSKAATCVACGGYQLPFIKYRRTFPGAPVTLFIGPLATRIDIHISVLAYVSTLFSGPDNVPLTWHSPISLPHLSPTSVLKLCDWIYTGVDPSAEDFQTLIALWIAAAALGAYPLQNRILEIAVEVLGREKGVKIGFEVLELVYRNTVSGSPLRGFVSACFVQRGAELQSEWFGERYQGLGIWQDLVVWIKKVAEVRLRTPFIEKEGGKGVWKYTLVKEEGKLQVIDWERTKLAVPQVLVFGEDGRMDLEGFVVDEGMAEAEAKRVITEAFK